MTAVDLIPTRILREGVARGTAEVTGATDLVLVDNDGNVWLDVTTGANGGGTISVFPSATFGGRSLEPEMIVLADNDDTLAGPWPPALYGDEVAITVAAPDPNDVTLRAFGI